MANRIIEIMSARTRAATIAKEDDSLTETDWLASLELQIAVDDAKRKAAYWERIVDEGEKALAKLGAPEPDSEKHKTFMQYVEGANS